MSSDANQQSSIKNNQSAANQAAVLIVEDDTRSARMLHAHLQSSGYRVSVVHSARDAQQSVSQAMPDLILCDVCLPEMDGIQFTQWFRQVHAGANAPIALITSSDDRKILARGLEAGADDFLTKPVNSLELRTRVRSLLRSKMLADELRIREQAALPFGGEDKLRVVGDDHCGGANPPSTIIVEDNPQERRLLTSQMSDLQCDTRVAGSVAAAMALMQEATPDLIILDLLLPDRNGYDLITLVKNDPNYSHVAILVVSSMSEVQDRVKALELGADDFIVKGYERVEFEARVRRLLRLKQSLDKLNTRCDQALRMAVTDSVTGLYTNGFMHETLVSQLSFARRYHQQYSVIFVDVDHFKQVNDRFGHAAGDKVLRRVASVIRGLVRQSDTLARYGGEEFVILAPHTDRDSATLLAERIRAEVATTNIPLDDDTSIQVTMSLGVATFPDDATDGPALIHRGDEAMYLAKQNGRNRVVAWSVEQTVSTRAMGAPSPVAEQEVIPALSG